MYDIKVIEKEAMNFVGLSEEELMDSLRSRIYKYSISKGESFKRQAVGILYLIGKRYGRIINLVPEAFGEELLRFIHENDLADLMKLPVKMEDDVKIEETECPRCRCRNLLNVNKPKEKRCVRCGFLLDPHMERFVNLLGSEEVRTSTHNYVKWICRKCDHHGFGWRERSGGPLVCPKCEAPAEILPCLVTGQEHRIW